jgi:hypothetical protein
MEAAGEWAQAVSLPRPRLLKALRDDKCVKAVLADVPCWQLSRWSLTAANPPRRISRIAAGTLAAIDEGAAAHGLTRYTRRGGLQKIRRG